MLYLRVLILFVWLGTFMDVSMGHADPERWRADSYSRNSYDQVYIVNIDLREISLEVCDDDEGFCESEVMDDHVFQELAHRLYESVEHKIRSVIPVVDSETIDSTQRNLLVDLKVSTDIVAEDIRFLQRMVMRAGENNEQLFSFECVIRDGNNKEELIRFADQQVSRLADKEAPFAIESDYDNISFLFDLWGREIQRLIR